MPTITQAASSDATGYGGNSQKAYGTAKDVGFNSGLSGRTGFIYFNRAFPLGATILSAKLRIWQDRVVTSATRTITAQRAGASWQESKLTFQNMPTGDGVTADSPVLTGAGTVGRLIEIDVTDIIQEVSSGADWFGFRLTSSSASSLYVYSREAKSKKPVLEIVWSDAPAQPSVLAPAGGRAVSIPRPTLRFDYTDPSGVAGMAAYQVQMNPTNDFTAPSVDTGEVPSTLPLYPLTADVAEGATRWWRARVKSATGLWSLWSDPVSFIRLAKEVITITNPAAAPNDFVSEPTPPFGWSVTGGTQTAYDVLVTDPVDVTAIKWDSGWYTTADNHATPPSNLPLTPGQQYRLEVRVQGATAREATPGDLPYSVAERLFTYDLSATVAPVTGLDVTIEQGKDAKPYGLLEWNSATAPDGYLITRQVGDGPELPIASTTDATDMIVSGTHYAYLDMEAPPRQDIVWKVARIVNGVTSSANPTVDGRFEPVGAWLSTADGLHTLWLWTEGSSEPVTFKPDEDVSLYTPFGAQNTYIVTQARRGRAGDSDSFAKPHSGQTIDDVRNTWAAMVDSDAYPYGEPLILTLVDTVLRCFWFDVMRAPKHGYVDKIPVEFQLREIL